MANIEQFVLCGVCTNVVDHVGQVDQRMLIKAGGRVGEKGEWEGDTVRVRTGKEEFSAHVRKVPKGLVLG